MVTESHTKNNLAVATADPPIRRQRITINGIVQGVGFRPFVFQRARTRHITGYVTNTATGVRIEAQGTSEDLENFLNDIKSRAPRLAYLTDIQTQELELSRDGDFRIIPSDRSEKMGTFIGPDAAVCPDCLQELFDRNDRRYRYPFINCTNCGPRYTIIKDIPYDRPYTTMSSFTLCPECQAEYDDPDNRRFHAQPNACPVCGPQVQLTDKSGKNISENDPILTAIELLNTGAVIAIKGLGGFHLAVDATNDQAVQTLRKRKGREEKPLAIMVRDVTQTRHLCHLSVDEEKSLGSVASPIVLLKKKPEIPIAEAVAPGNHRLGVMLPYTPLHHLLLNSDLTALVMTSGNISEEPICIDNEDAYQRLQEIADYFLLHNRDIHIRSDDSVVVHMENKLRPIRRSRGFVPVPIPVRSQGSPVLAVGGELKNTLCLLKHDQALMSHHVGDLKNMRAYRFFEQTVDHLQRIYETTPDLIVHDLHPQYLSTQWAQKQTEIPTLAVQHHHAHLAACYAEHQLEKPVIGLIFDGTGYGPDGTIWGGEILIGDDQDFTRAGHLEHMPLPGGDAAIIHPWRTAVAYLYSVFGDAIPDLPFLVEHSEELPNLLEILEKDVHCPRTSSVGRLFDAIAAMSGGRQSIRYEAQAAIEFMQCADVDENTPVFDFEIEQVDDQMILSVASIIRSVVETLKSGETLSGISNRFHRALTKATAKLAMNVRENSGINQVVLSGGVFQNEILFSQTVTELKKNDFQVFTHRKVPTNDGGIALGQAVIGRKYLS